MLNIVLFEPEIPGNTGNIMRTCVATRYWHKHNTSFDYSNKEENIYFFLGKESTGIPRSILKPFIDRCMRIPMTSNVRALNVSNAAASIIYEALRQQNYNDLLLDEPHKSKTFIEEA